MKTAKINVRHLFVFALIVLVASTRLMTFLPNFSPLTAISLFGGAYFVKKWQAILIPILCVWTSDLLVNNILYKEYFQSFTFFYQGFYWQYLCYAIIALVSIFALKKVTTLRVLTIGLFGTLLFFLISNFGVWISSNMYPKSLEGLIQCYIAGIPFIKGTLLGDLGFSALLFGTFALAEKQFPVLNQKTIY